MLFTWPSNLPVIRFDAVLRITKRCERASLAKVSQYTYPRAGQKINGPYIRLAEAIAQAWGNIDSTLQTVNQSDVATIVQVVKVFCAPDIQVKAGAKLLTSHMGETREYQCSGEPGIFSFSVNEKHRFISGSFT